MKSSKLKRVINNNKWRDEEGFDNICNAFNSHLYKELISFKGWYCGECDMYNLYKLFYKDGVYYDIRLDHLSSITYIKSFSTQEELQRYIDTYAEYMNLEKSLLSSLH